MIKKLTNKAFRVMIDFSFLFIRKVMVIWISRSSYIIFRWAASLCCCARIVSRDW